MMADADGLDIQGRLFPYHRLRAIGHVVHCTCEHCFVHIERVIEQYIPGFFLLDPLELRLREVEHINAELRRENARLRTALKGAVLPTSCQPPATKSAQVTYRGVDVQP
jgi:hypothetical protein